MKRVLAAVMATAILIPAAAWGGGDEGFRQVLQVREGMRIEVDNPKGYVVVRDHDRDEVVVEAEHGECSSLEVRTYGDVVLVRPDHGSSCKHSLIDLLVDVPTWMPVEISGNQTEVDVRGLTGGVSVNVVDGEIFVERSEGRIFLRSVQGSIEVEHSLGEIDVGTHNDNIYLADVDGQILAETINGNLRMEGIISSDLEAITLNGNIYYDGTMNSDGNYYFSSHEGNVQLSVPESSNLTVNVASAEGEFSCDFDVRPINTQPGKRFRFVLGSGSGQLRIESFNGDIELYDPKDGRRKRNR